MQWDDYSNVELHVVEPSGHKCYPMRSTTKVGILSSDCNGFGPVEYMAKYAQSGKYDVFLKLFTKKQSSVVCLVDISTNFGRENEERVRKTIMLKNEKETVLVTTLQF